MEKMASIKSKEARFQEFFQWIESRGGTLNPSISIKQFHNDLGNGIIATTEIPKNTTLFTLPRPEFSKKLPLLLTVETSKILSYLNLDDRLKISKNWLPLVLVLIWERVNAILYPSIDNSWAPYFNIL